MRFTRSRVWWSAWQHPGSLGRGMYSGYDYYLIKSLDTIELRDPNMGIVERFVDSGDRFIFGLRCCRYSGHTLGRGETLLLPPAVDPYLRGHHHDMCNT